MVLLVLLGDSTAFASSHFECHLRTGKTSFEDKVSASLIPYVSDLRQGSVLDYDASTKVDRHFHFNGTSSDPRSGKAWVHLTQVNEEDASLRTVLSIETIGHSRMMNVVTMRESVFVAAESYRCDVESSI